MQTGLCWWSAGTLKAPGRGLERAVRRRGRLPGFPVAGALIAAVTLALAALVVLPVVEVEKWWRERRYQREPGRSSP